MHKIDVFPGTSADVIGVTVTHQVSSSTIVTWEARLALIRAIFIPDASDGELDQDRNKGEWIFPELLSATAAQQKKALEKIAPAKGPPRMGFMFLAKDAPVAKTTTTGCTAGGTTTYCDDLMMCDEKMCDEKGCDDSFAFASVVHAD